MGIHFLSSFNANSSANSVNYKQYNPKQALQNYMTNNNCDEVTAKTSLESMYGVPSENSQTSTHATSKQSSSNSSGTKYNQGNNPQEDFDNQLLMLGIPQDIVQTHNQNTIKQYADGNNIQLPNPPQRGSKLNFMS